MSALTDAHSSTIALHSVPWNDYSNVPCFKTQSELDSYFDRNQVVLYTLMTYIRNDATYRVQMDINTFKENHINYMTFDNGSGREYAFVRNPRFVDLNCTEFDIETDVWVTYMFKHDVSGIVERAHVDRWNSRGYPIYYRLDNNSVGVQDVVHSERDSTGIDVIWLFIYCSDYIPDYVPKFAQYGKNCAGVGSSVNPLPLYLTAIVVNSDNTLSYPTNICFAPYFVDGGKYYQTGLLDLPFFTSENIVSIQASYYVPFLYIVTKESGDYRITITDPSITGEYINISTSDKTGYVYAVNDMPSRFSLARSFDKWYNIPTMPNHNTPASYIYESRLYYAPYSFCTLVNGSEKLDIDPSMITTVNAFIVRLIMALGAGDYALDAVVTNWSDDELGILNHAIDTSPKTVGWRTDPYYNYKIQNEAQINNNIKMQAISASINLIKSLSVGVVTGTAAAGSLSSLPALSGASSGASSGTNPFNTGLSPGTTSSALSGFKGLYMYASQQRALETDLKNSPDTAVSPVGGLGSIIGNCRYAISVLYRRCTPFYLELYGSEFMRYGYTLNKLCTNFNIRTRYWYNYVKYSTVVCTGTKWLMPHHKTVLEEMYLTGFTAWHYTSTAFSQFGKYNLDNTEVSIDGA